MIQDKRKLENIDFTTIVGTYMGHSIFSIFHDEEKLHEQILFQLQETDWEPETLEDDSEIQNNVLRRLYRVLTMPVPDMVKKDEKPREVNGIRRKVTPTPKSMQTNRGTNKVIPADNNESLENVIEQDIEDQDDDSAELTASKTDKRMKKGLYSVLQKSLFHPSQRIRDILMSITNICDEC